MACARGSERANERRFSLRRARGTADYHTWPRRARETESSATAERLNAKRKRPVVVGVARKRTRCAAAKARGAVTAATCRLICSRS